MKIRYFKDDMDLVMVEGAEAAATIAIEKLNLIMGEWYRDSSVGIPWLSDIVGSTFNSAKANFICSYIVNELSTIPEISTVDVTDLQLDPETRRVNVKVSLQYMDQEITLEQTYGV